MPWKAKDAKRHTHKAKSAKRKRQWKIVANSVLKRTGDEGRAVRSANAAVKHSTAGRGGKKKTRRKRTSAKR